MLVEDYRPRVEELISSLPQRIQLPAGSEQFFDQTGALPTHADDVRLSVRTRVRTRGILIAERWLPSCERGREPIVIYTRDFSKKGFGFVADEQYFPGEVVRVLLATFWMRVTIRWSRRLGPTCFEVGSELLQRNDPSSNAFEWTKSSAASGGCLNS